ncbi:hypothetical protein ACVW1A_006586 [Bradyrhizobium sp. LB1.3]
MIRKNEKIMLNRICGERWPIHPNPIALSVQNQKFGGLQIDSVIEEALDVGEDWRWVDALFPSNSMS